MTKEPMYELLFETNEIIHKFRTFYQEWSLLKHTVKPYNIQIERDGRPVMLHGDAVTWAEQNVRTFHESV
ncbi:hypothetical protein PAE9249_01149 [Paenibacillus sp. CECT 9249]|nr:hypothetical protein PAE9249_01149 [Paenibacillus sp. CECT 9249]